MTAPRISLALGDGMATDPSTVIADFANGRLRDGVNDGTDLSFTIPARTPAAQVLDGLATDIWVYRNGSLFRRCRCLPLTQSWGEDGEDDVTVQAVSYRKLLDYRHIWTGPPTYTAVDQGTIAWNLVAHTQGQTGGALGITMGTVATGVNRDRTEYKLGDNIGKLLDDLSDVDNGIWWTINATKVFSAKLRTTWNVAAVPIVLGVNARSLRRTPAKGFANAVMATGSDVQTTPEVFVSPTILTDPRGRWEAITSNGSIIAQPTLVQRAAGFYQDRSIPGATWSVSLDPARYFEGDSLFVRGDTMSINVPASAVDPIGQPAVNATAQLLEVSIGFDGDGQTTVDLECLEV